MDYTTLHPMCANQAHLVDLHLWRGAPQNHDEDRPIQILVNQGYVVGFCTDRLQPAWSAYRVADADRDVDFQRPLHYYDDMRLDEAYRIGRRTFGKIGGIQLNVGHMSPNEVINRQFGRLAQTETFLMSNMSPQYGSLNQGVWLKLETAIREINDDAERDHVWVIVGPVFGEDSASIYRGNGKYVPVPEKYFCITVDPFRYPYDTPSNVNIDCFLIPQNAPRSSSPEDYPATLDEIEEATQLKFFHSWGRETPVGQVAAQKMRSDAGSGSRLMRILQSRRSEVQAVDKPINAADVDADSVDDLIETLKAEAARVQIQSSPLTEDDLAELKTLQHTISWLIRAREVANPEEAEAEPVNLITYKIVGDMDDRLKISARMACNFWNRFVQPKYSIVIRLGIFTQASNTIARAYIPFEEDGVRYGPVEFNTKFLVQFSAEEIAGTIVHEIGHSLGIGWKEWDKLFDPDTGKFTHSAIDRLGVLKDMEVELDGGPGTERAHWDEAIFDKELMTGYKDKGEHVLPVTIDLMKVLGHKVTERLEARTQLSGLLQQAASVVFSRQDEVRHINLDHFEKTGLLETIPHADISEEEGAVMGKDG